MDLNYDNWKLFADEFVSVLELQKQPIAITYSNEEVQSTMKKAITICKALQLVSSGEIICMSKTKCACPGGKWHVGFAEKRDGIEKTLVEGEKLWASVAVANQSLSETHRIAPPPLGLANFIIFSPLNKANLRPDLILIFANPFQASRLIFLADYHGYPIKPRVTGSLCWSAITYPLVTGNFNITMGDPTARRHYEYDQNELIVSIPYRMIPSMMDALEHSTAGKGKPAELFAQRAQRRER
jgi:uncharacterized protein (DUF169 family)